MNNTETPLTSYYTIRSTDRTIDLQNIQLKDMAHLGVARWTVRMLRHPDVTVRSFRNLDGKLITVRLMK